MSRNSLIEVFKLGAVVEALVNDVRDAVLGADCACDCEDCEGGIEARLYLRPSGAFGLCLGDPCWDTDHRGECESLWFAVDESESSIAKDIEKAVSNLISARVSELVMDINIDIDSLSEYFDLMIDEYTHSLENKEIAPICCAVDCVSDILRLEIERILKGMGIVEDSELDGGMSTAMFDALYEEGALNDLNCLGHETLDELCRIKGIDPEDYQEGNSGGFVSEVRDRLR